MNLEQAKEVLELYKIKNSEIAIKITYDQMIEMNNHDFKNKVSEAIGVVLKELETQKEMIEFQAGYRQTLEQDLFEGASNFVIPKDKIRKFIKEELPDDETCECCDNYDVNGVLIKQKLMKVLEEG